MACVNGVDERLQISGRGRFGPCPPPACERDGRGQPTSDRAERVGPTGGRGEPRDAWRLLG